MAILQVTASHDYRLDALSNITEIDFDGAFTAIFDQSQFGGAGISNSLLVSGFFDGADPIIEVRLTPGGIGFSTVEWTVATGSTALVRLIGGATSETMTGSNDADHEFIGGGGADTLTGANETDIFIYAVTGDVEAGEKVDGGGLWEGEGYDRIRVSATNDFRGAEITDIEFIDILGAGTTATFFDDQLRVADANFVDKDTMNVWAEESGGAVQTLVVYADPIDSGGVLDAYASLKYVSFSFWGKEDVILIKGTGEDDFLFGSYEADTIVAGDGKDELDGRHGKDSLDGGAGRDRLDGAADKDVLAGGADKDAFVFASPLKGGKNLDRIADFEKGIDIIKLEREDFVGLDKGKLDKDAFLSGDDVTKAKDAQDRIVYNETTGALYFDKDGKGGAKAIQFAVLDGAPDLEAGDIIVFA
jgi:Ca2+-binding RTX toxin-like protein